MPRGRGARVVDTSLGDRRRIGGRDPRGRRTPAPPGCTRQLCLSRRDTSSPSTSPSCSPPASDSARSASPAFSRLRVLGDRRIPGTPRWMRWGSAGAIAIGIGTAAALWVPLGSEIRADTAQDPRAPDQAVRADRAVPVIQQALANVAGGVGEPDRSKVLAPPEADRQILVVPSPLRPRLAVDTGVGLTKIAGLGAPTFETVESLVHLPGARSSTTRGQREAGAPTYAALEAPNPVIDGVRPHPAPGRSRRAALGLPGALTAPPARSATSPDPR